MRKERAGLQNDLAPRVAWGKAFILAKNEESNIRASVSALVNADLDVIVLDSGSVDSTVDIAGEAGASIIKFTYTSHCDAYNYITSNFGENDIILIIDADMIVPMKLAEEIRDAFSRDFGVKVGVSGVDMYCDGKLLRNASLCPPKPIAFRGGREYFRGVGHGECLIDCLVPHKFENKIAHNDNKTYESFLLSQKRYGANILMRARSGQLGWRDRVRLRVPILAILVPAYSYIFKLGFLDGKAGLAYAIDRMIAELILYRVSLLPDPSGGKEGCQRDNCASETQLVQEGR